FPNIKSEDEPEDKRGEWPALLMQGFVKFVSTIASMRAREAVSACLHGSSRMQGLCLAMKGPAFQQCDKREGDVCGKPTGIHCKVLQGSQKERYVWERLEEVL
uniref:Uncharacterized protein n=1 Tax=Aegilops tauschii subsp. strangulata TaxID=200361 RepID=A0A453NMV6_AEGTS